MPNILEFEIRERYAQTYGFFSEDGRQTGPFHRDEKALKILPFVRVPRHQRV